MRSPDTSRGIRTAGRLAAMLGWLTLLAGCEPGVSVPDGSSGGGVVVPPVSEPGKTVPTIGLSLPEAGNLAIAAFEQTIRREAAASDAIVVVESSPPGKQAEGIRELTSRGIGALVVLPAPGEPIGPVLNAVDAEGCPVVLFGRPAPEGAEALPRVNYTPYEESARALVQAAVEDAREAGFPADAPAVILVNGPYDPDSRELLAALHEALDAAKVPTLPDVPFQGYQEKGKDAFEPFFQEHPDLALAFAIEDQGIKALADFRNQLDHKGRRFVMAGFAYQHDTTGLADYNLAAAIAEIRPEAVARRAFQTALKRAEGQSFPEPIIVETRLIRADGPERPGYLSILTPPTPTNPAAPTPPPVETAPADDQ